MNIKPIAIAVSLFFSISALAQHNEEVTIEGTYRPKVNKVDKIVLKPETPEQKFEMPAAKTHLMEVDRRFPLEFEKLDAQYYNGKNARMPESTKNFLLVGMGSRISPVFLYKHNSNLTKNLGLGVGIKHYSSWLDIKDYAPSSFMNNAFEIGLTSSKYKGVQLGGNVYYKNDMVHYYGVNLTEMPLTEAQIDQYCPRQTYNTIGGHFGLASTTTRVGEWSHSGGLDYRHTFDGTYAREHFAGVEYGLGYTQNWWGNKSHPQKIGMDMALEYECFESSHADFTGMPVVNRSDLYLIKVNPFFEMDDEFYKLHLGVRLDGVNRIQDEDKLLAVYPDVSGSLYVLNKKLEFYAGLNGGRKLLTYSEIINENPFVGNNLALRAENVRLGFNGGVRTNIAEVVDLHLGVRYGNVGNLPCYLLLPEVTAGGGTIANKYGIEYYEDVQVVNVLADLRVKLRNSLTADLGIAYNHYDLNLAIKDSHAEYRPTTEGKLKLTYDLNEKLSFYSSFLYQGGCYAVVPKGEFDSSLPGWRLEEKKLKDVFDLSLGADYRVNDQLSVFAKLDNVAHQKYQLYYNYPVTGIQFFAGLKMRF